MWVLGIQTWDFMGSVGPKLIKQVLSPTVCLIDGSSPSVVRSGLLHLHNVGLQSLSAIRTVISAWLSVGMCFASEMCSFRGVTCFLIESLSLCLFIDELKLFAFKVILFGSYCFQGLTYVTPCFFWFMVLLKRGAALVFFLMQNQFFF